MSWSINIDAPTKTRAKEMVADSAQVPEAIRTFIERAIDAYPQEDTVLKVVAYGHDAQHSRDKSSASVQVHAV